MILWRWWSEEEGECSLGRVKSKTGQDKVVEMSRDSLGEEKGNNVTWDCPAVAAATAATAETGRGMWDGDEK